MLYRKRLRIGLFFKWIKQHLHIKAFFGLSFDAVKSQIWIAWIDFMLAVWLKHRNQQRQDLNQILQILSVPIPHKEPVFKALWKVSSRRRRSQSVAVIRNGSN